MKVEPTGLTIDGATHHRGAVNGTHLHYVAAGTAGSPIILVHGFPESWWAFHKVIPHLLQRHRVYAVDLRGFGDSDAAAAHDDSTTMAQDLHALVEHLDVGPVHLLVQDVSGTIGVRVAAAHPADLVSLIAVESVVSGFGLKKMADVANGGAWYFGVLATPGAAQAFFGGRARRFIDDFIMPSVTVVPNAVSEKDVAELARGYDRPNGWSGAFALYGGILGESDDVRAMAKTSPLTLPLMAIDHGDSTATRQSFGAIHAGKIEAVSIDGVGHYIAIEAPERLAEQVARFISEHDRPFKPE